MKEYKILYLATFLIVLNLSQVSCFWDSATTTFRYPRDDDAPRTSFFRWQWVFNRNWQFWFYYWDWYEIELRRRLYMVAGISIDMIPLSTGTLLNRRTVITSYNYLDPYINRQMELRIWALGRTGLHNTPYRYRVWSVTRLIPLSLNPEHCHGPRCTHQPRHDVAIIFSLDQIYIYLHIPHRWHYAFRGFVVPSKWYVLYDDIWMAGSGYEYMEHVEENYKIFYYKFNKKHDIVDCSKYLPKWWGKFICIRNVKGFPGVQNGGGFYSGSYVAGLGCFEIRYNEDRIFVFTDLRYYYLKVYHYAHIYPGNYYEYAYPQWSVYLGFFSDQGGNYPYPAHWMVRHDIYPLG